MSAVPLIWAGRLDAPFAWRAGEPISRRQYLADVQLLAPRLPAAGPMLNTTADRYRFAVGLGAAMLRGHANLLPPNHTPDTVARLRDLFPRSYALSDDTARTVDLPVIWTDTAHAAVPDRIAVPEFDADLLTAHVLTSGSTGAPMPHAKRWGLLVRNTQAGARRIARQMGRPEVEDAPLAGVSLVATVPAQHMYGFESTVLLAMLSGAAFETERPFYPADIARALAQAPRPRMLVTTPFHLKMLQGAGILLPPIDLTVCATAPLPPQLAAQAEAALGAPLMEIYGCTEAGQVASRRPMEGAEWRTYDGLALGGDGAHSVISGGHVPEPTPLADVLEVLDAQTFRLLGRSNDLINIAGKRSSLGHLNYHLNSIAGVQDGAFWLPPEAEAEAPSVVRLAAFVVAPGVAHEQILAALRKRIDAAFLPRPIVSVDSLPREATGKLPSGVLGAWAAPLLPSRAKPGPAWIGGPIPTVSLPIPLDHPAFAGHFPGQPLLPGVVLLAEVLEVVLRQPGLADLVGPAATLAQAKFLAPVRPGDELSLKLERSGRRLAFEVACGARLVASGQFLERPMAPPPPTK